MIDRKEQHKRHIKAVEREIRNEPDRRKKQRLNKYKQKLELELRDYIFFKNGGRYAGEKNAKV